MIIFMIIIDGNSLDICDENQPKENAIMKSNGDDYSFCEDNE